MSQSIVSYIHKSLLTRSFSHCLILPKTFSVRWAKVTLGRLKQNSCWQQLTISILFVLNSFMKNLLMTTSIEDICDLFSGRVSSPYRRTGIHLVFKRWSVTSSVANLPILPKIALAALSKERFASSIEQLNVLDWTIIWPGHRCIATDRHTAIPVDFCLPN